MRSRSSGVKPSSCAPSGSAARTKAGTVADVRLVAGACAAASEVEPSSEVIPANRTEHQTPKAAKRLSRSAAIRQARAAQATKAATRAASTEPHPPLALPEVAVPEVELSAKVEEAIAETGAEGPSDMGKVMGLLKERAAGRADGKRLSTAVRERLAS